MRLDTGSGSPIDNPTSDQVREVLASFRPGNRDDFAILSSGDQTYIQAAIVEDGSFYVEYRDGGAEKHFRAMRSLSLAEVQRVFLLYLAGDLAFSGVVEWEPLSQSRVSCFGLSLMLVLSGALLVAFGVVAVAP